jgi:hypothetical protein
VINSWGFIGTGTFRMSDRFLADALVLAHLLFIVFVLFGGVLVLHWPRLALAHLPAVCWGALIELTGGYCPLTPLENRWRQAAGEAGYHGSFIEHYLLPIIYPAELTRGMQLAMGAVVIGVNLAIYGWLVRRHRR